MSDTAATSTDRDPFAQRFREALHLARHIGDTVFRPNAEATDRADGPPVAHLHILAESGLLGLTVPHRWGGIGADGRVVRQFTELMASACGVTAFVAGQHVSACAQLAASENERLQAELLPLLGRGERLCGLAFSHVRRPGAPTMRVTDAGDHWVFSGVAPWFTGWPAMTDCLLAGTLPNDRLVFAAVPLQNTHAIKASAPMRLCAMSASGTVSLTARDCRIAKARTVKLLTRAQMEESDRKAVLGVTAQPLGVASAATRLVRMQAEALADQALTEAADLLQTSADLLRDEVDHWIIALEHPDYLRNALRVRADCILFAVRAAHAALAVAGGKGNSLAHPAQRLFREAMFYTVIAQTEAVRRATVTALTNPCSTEPSQPESK